MIRKHEEKVKNLKEAGLWVSFRTISQAPKRRKSKDVTTCTIFHNKEKISEGMALRNNEDRPNFVIGRSLAFDRALAGIKPEFQAILKDNILIRYERSES